VTTASGSGSSGEPAGYQTDPSSENSSMDRIAPAPMGKEPTESYGFNGFGGDPNYAPPGAGLNQAYNPAQRQGNGYMDHASPPPPQKDAGPRVPIKLGNSTGTTPTTTETSRPSPGEKRKSWFGRRFSKS